MHPLRKGRRLRIALGVMATASWWTGAAYGQTVPVILTWSEDPRTTMTVFWQRLAPGRGTVRYGLTTNYTHAACDGGGTRRHRVTLRALTPGTLYHYEAASTDGFTAGDRTFRTASGPTGSVNLVVHGDLHGGYSATWSRSVAEAIRNAGPDLVIHTGDLSNQHDTPGFSTWGDFFNVTTDELDRVVFMPAPGNHDDPGYGSAYFWQLFNLPTRPVSGNPCSYRAGGIHFQALDSDAGVQAQTNWMMRDLQSAAYDTNVAWIVPYFHRPPYSWGQRAGDDFIKTNWARLFTMYEADLVFSGHSHNYQRTVPIRGVTYVVAGGGGGTLYDSVFTPGSHEYATTCYHFVSMQVTGSVMRYRAIRSDGLVFEDLVLTNARRKVRVEPAFPQRGASAKILYDAAQGPLFYSSPVYLHLGVDAFTNALVSAAMTYNASSGLWEYDYIVPAGTSNRIAFVFRDTANTNWDNNHTYNWQALLDDMPYVPDETPTPRLVVAGSPVITDNPAPQNNVGDNFDLATNGAPLEARDTSGFGDFGRLYFNYDATNLYVGGIGADLGGSNNVFVLFLGLDTLADDAENLWHKSGLPQTLDQMHNLTFVEPMDLAIVFGNEWGDGPTYTNFTYAGYNFGQGLYYIGTNSATFAAITNARLSQFDGSGFSPCISGDDDGDERTDRWEAGLPWSALNAPGGATSVTWILVGGVMASRSTNGNDRYLSATYAGDRAFGTKDDYGNFGYNFVTLAPVKIALEHGDEDNDGLPNGWEHAYFDSVIAGAAADDSDEDGMDNESEYVAGTRPNDEYSVFQARTLAAPAAGGVVLQWSSESNRIYAVYGATNLQAAFEEKAAGLLATPPSNVYTADVGVAQSGFFRVNVNR